MRPFKLTLLLALLSCSLFADTSYFTYQIGDPQPSPQYWSITSQTTSQILNLAVRTSGQAWLGPSLSSTVTPSTLTISVNPVGLSVGGYAGSVEVYSPQMANTIHIDVSLTVTPAPPPLMLLPTNLVFNVVQGSAPPAAQSLQIGASLPAGTSIFTTITPDPLPSWLRINNSTFWIGIFVGSTTLQFSVDPSSLAPGTYTASIKFYTIFPDRQATLPINLNVSAPPPVLRTSLNQLQFQCIIGCSAPASQTVQVTSSGSPLSTSVSVNAPWFSASTLSGTTPFSIDIKANPSGLAVGAYKAQVVISTNPFAQSSSSQTIDVTLTVLADNRPVITSVVNGASFKPTISPGAWVSIIGKNFSATTNQATTAVLGTTMNGVSVQLSGTGAAYSLLVHYVSPTQINAFVPHEVSPLMFGTGAGSQLTVTASGGAVSYPVDCEPIAPALFSYGSNNYAAAVFPDGAIVGSTPGTKPATSGAIISLYGTGFGQTVPFSTNVNGSVPVRPLASDIGITVGGVPVNVLWAGMVGIGLYQFNIEVPEMPAPGDYPVVVQISGTNSPNVGLPIR